MKHPPDPDPRAVARVRQQLGLQSPAAPREGYPNVNHISEEELIHGYGGLLQEPGEGHGVDRVRRVIVGASTRSFSELIHTVDLLTNVVDMYRAEVENFDAQDVKTAPIMDSDQANPYTGAVPMTLRRVGVAVAATYPRIEADDGPGAS